MNIRVIGKKGDTVTQKMKFCQTTGDKEIKKNGKYTGRADLLMLFQAFGRNGLDNAAECLGFYPKFRRKMEPQKPQRKKRNNTLVDAVQPTVEHRFDTQEPNVRFWRVMEYKDKGDQGQEADVPDWFNNAMSLAHGGEIPPSAPPVLIKPPLQPWSAMWPFLLHTLGYYRDGKSINIRRVLDSVVHGVPISQLPFRKRVTWASDAQLILDMSDRLLPFWDDMTGLRHRLEKLRGTYGLEVLVFEWGPERPCRRWGRELRPYHFPPPGSPVMVLSDLGCFEKMATVRQAWLRFGKRLKQAGFFPQALTPCPPTLWDGSLTGVWNLASWDRGERLPRYLEKRYNKIHRVNRWTHGPGREQVDIGRKGVDELLGLLSAAIRVEPALLRAVRLMLPKKQVNVGTEAAVWNHDNVCRSPLAFAFKTGDAVGFYRKWFSLQPIKLRKRVIECIKKYHAGLPKAVRVEEELIAVRLLERDEDTEERDGKGCNSLDYFKRVVKTLFDKGFFQRYSLRQWVNRLGERMHPEGWTNNGILAAAWLKANLDEWEQGRSSLPIGMDIRDAAWVLGRRREKGVWELRRRGNRFVLARGGVDDKKGEGDWVDRGSILAELNLGNPWIMIRYQDNDGNKRVVLNLAGDEKEARELPIPNLHRFTLETDHDRMVLEAFKAPYWASEIRRDQTGLSTVYTNKEVQRRLHWLNPGKYEILPRQGVNEGRKKQAVLFTVDQGCWMDEVEFTEFRQYGLRQPDWADIIGVDEYGVYADLNAKGVVQRMRFIFPGEFKMRSPKDEPECNKDETLHDVLLTRGFWLADTVCTQKLWTAVMGENPTKFKGVQCLMEQVSCDYCIKFIKKINQLKSGLELRLPSVVEWEYAFRAGTSKPFSFGKNITPAQVNYDSETPNTDGEEVKASGETVDMKALPYNKWGLNQKHGNVREWCTDWFCEYPTDIVVDPPGTASSSRFVLRGGRWMSYDGDLRYVLRQYNQPLFGFDVTGFRLARGYSLVE